VLSATRPHAPTKITARLATTSHVVRVPTHAAIFKTQPTVEASLIHVNDTSAIPFDGWLPNPPAGDRRSRAATMRAS
jgi:hypothetical protein